MAIKFGDAKGTAQKGSFDQYTYKTGTNRVRLLGDILPRYVYWIPGMNGKNLPMECLGFDRESEKFKNQDKDHVQVEFPDIKCSWSYSMLCWDYDQGKVVVLNLKKKLLEQIQTLAEDLGDPTDLDAGWDVYFEKKKTGPNAFNVEYTVLQLKCSNGKGAVSDSIKESFADAVKIDDLIVRPSAESQLSFLEKLRKDKDGGEDKVDSEVEDEFDIDQGN